MKLNVNTYGDLVNENGKSFRIDDSVVIVPTKNEILEQDNGEWKNYYVSEAYVFDKVSREKYSVSMDGVTTDKIPQIRVSPGQAKKLLLMAKNDSIAGKKFGFAQMQFTKESVTGEKETIQYFAIKCLEIGVSFKTVQMKKYGDGKTFSGNVSWNN